MKHMHRVRGVYFDLAESFVCVICIRNAPRTCYLHCMYNRIAGGQWPCLSVLLAIFFGDDTCM
jgi:hypothetical protein